MKIVFLIGGLMIIIFQFVIFDFDEINSFTGYFIINFYIIGSVFILEGMSYEPRFKKIEEKITKLKEEVLELRYPLESNDND